MIGIRSLRNTKEFVLFWSFMEALHSHSKMGLIGNNETAKTQRIPSQ